MSAAASAAPRRSRSVPVPAHMRTQVSLPEKYVCYSIEFCEAKARKCPDSHLAVMFLDWLYCRCFGGHKTAGGYERPEWVPVRAEVVAQDLLASGEGVLKVLDQLENMAEDEAGRPIGLIRGELVGKVKWYRLCPENYSKLEDREPREARRKPVSSDTEIHTGEVQEVKPDEPLVLMPGAQGRPVPLSEHLSARYTNRCDFPLAVVAKPAGDNIIDIDIFLQRGSKGTKANLSALNTEAQPHRPTAVRRFAGDHENTANNGNGTSSGTRKSGAGKPREDSFGKFLEAWTAAEMPASREDFNLARLGDKSRGKLGWVDLSLEQRMTVIKDIPARRASGEWDDAVYRMLPQNYIAKHVWERPIRGKPKSKTEQMYDEIDKIDLRSRMRR